MQIYENNGLKRKGDFGSHLILNRPYAIPNH